MATVTGLTLVKRFTYRGDTMEEFSNTYHFKDAPPADATAWTALALAAWTAEAQAMHGGIKLVRAYGYDSDDPHAHAVWSKDYTVPGPPPSGTLTAPGGQSMAGDQAALVEWKTSRINSRGKPIWLRKYFHGGFADSANPDNLTAVYSTALTNYKGGAPLGIQGVGGGLRSRSHDETIAASKVSPYVTTRTLKRRGKRPS